MSIIIFLIILLVLVLVHEFGHFFTAKRFGIRVDEFGFGFPPKLFGWKKGETEYSVNALPFGGFVKIFGENPAGRSFVNKPKWQQAMVLFAGVFANFLLAWLLFSAGFISGLPTSADSKLASYNLEDVNLVVISILKNSPAENAGLQVGDKIVSLKNNSDFTSEINPEKVKSFVLESRDKEIEIGYLRSRDTEIKFVKAVPAVNEVTGSPEIGISMDMIGTAKLPFFTALYEGMKLNLNVTKNTAIGLFTLIYEGILGRGSLEGIAGPVGIVGIVGDAYQFGFVYLLSFAALISINLAIINLFPFPALDGGRLLFLLIEKIKGSRINLKFANAANMVGFSLLILLMLIVTYHDIIKLF